MPVGALFAALRVATEEQNGWAVGSLPLPTAVVPGSLPALCEQGCPFPRLLSSPGVFLGCGCPSGCDEVCSRGVDLCFPLEVTVLSTLPCASGAQLLWRNVHSVVCPLQVGRLPSVVLGASFVDSGSRGLPGHVTCTYCLALFVLSLLLRDDVL